MRLERGGVNYFSTVTQAKQLWLARPFSQALKLLNTRTTSVRVGKGDSSRLLLILLEKYLRIVLILQPWRITGVKSLIVDDQDRSSRDIVLSYRPHSTRSIIIPQARTLTYPRCSVPFWLDANGFGWWWILICWFVFSLSADTMFCYYN